MESTENELKMEEGAVFPGIFESEMGVNRLICGIAAMEKKCSSKPMQQVCGEIEDLKLFFVC